MQLVTRHSSFVTARLGRALVTLAAALFAATTVRANQTSPNPTMQQLRDDLVEFAPEVPNNSYGDVISFQYYSNSAGRPKNVNVLRPPNFDSNRKYPVLFVLHGIFGDESSMLDDSMGVRKMIAYAIAEGKTRDMIVVFPQMYTCPTSEQPEGFSFDQQTMRYYDMFEKDLLEDLLPWVREEFSVAEGRANTAITGFSLGGREALYIGTRHTDVFGFVGAACPAPGILPTKDQFMEHEGTIKNEADFRLKDGNPEPHVLLISGGTNDGTVGNYPEQYHNILQRNEVDHVWHSISGAGHDGSSVQPHLYNFVRHLFNVADDVPYFDPAGGTNAVRSVYIPYTGQDTLDSGWYVVDGSVAVESRITVNGDVNLILKDNASLTASKGFKVGADNNVTNSLTVWAQSEGANMGRLIAKGVGGNAGVGGDYGGYAATADDMAGLIIHRNNPTGQQWLLLEDARGDASNAASGSYHVVRRAPNGGGSFSFVEGDLYERETLGKTTVFLGQTDEAARAAVDAALAGVEDGIIIAAGTGSEALGNYLQRLLKSTITVDHQISYSVMSTEENSYGEEDRKYTYEISINLDGKNVKDIVSFGNPFSIIYNNSFEGSVQKTRTDAFVKTVTETVWNQTATTQLLLIQNGDNSWSAYTRTGEDGRPREYNLNMGEGSFGTPEARNDGDRLDSLDEVWFAYLPNEAVTTLTALKRTGSGEAVRNGADSQLNGGYFKDDANNAYRFVQAADQGACGTVRINGGLVMACAEDGAQAVGHGLNAVDELNLAFYDDAMLFTDALSQTPVTGTACAGACRGAWARILPRTAFAPVPYLDPTTHTTNTCYQYAPYDGQTTLERGWYVVADDLTNGTRIAVSDDVHLLLCDGASLTASQGVNVCVDGTITNSLTIWAQSDGEGMGGLMATGGVNQAAIGGDNNRGCGTVTVNGGEVIATGNGRGAGVGGGLYGAGGTVTINGGTVTAIGGEEIVYNAAGSHRRGGAGIGGGDGGAGGNVTVNGGKVEAIGKGGGAGIGGGLNGAGGTVTVDGGTVKALGGEMVTLVTGAGGAVISSMTAGGAGIGGGYGGAGGDVTISGGKVEATGTGGGAGIGGGVAGAGGRVTVDGGTVKAFGSEGALTGAGTKGGGAGIGGGEFGAGGTITITGGTVTAIAGAGAQAVGHGQFDTGEGTLDFPGTYRAYSHETDSVPVDATNRMATCRGARVKLALCEDHRYADYRNNGDGADHTFLCQYCGTDGVTEPHDFGADGLSCPCGARRYVVTVVGGSTTNTPAVAGTMVPVVAGDPGPGNAFVEWTSDDGVVFTNAVTAETAFAMPATNVTVTAKFEPIVIADIPDQMYTGAAIEPQPAVSCDGSQLAAGTDYNFSYLNNTNAGTATATVTMRHPRTGSASKTFEIAKAPGLTVSLAGGSFIYDGRPHALSGPATNNAAGGTTTVKYSKNQSDWTADLSSLTATDVADSCTIYVCATNPNYSNTATATAALTITKAGVGGGTEEPGGGEVPAGGVSKFDASFVYDGKGHTIDTNALAAAFSSAMGEGTGITYAPDDGGAPSATWTAEAPAFTNVGEYVVWYTAANPNYDDFVHAAKVTIAKAANAWVTAPSMKGWMAGATPATPNRGRAKFGTVTVAYGVAGGAAGGLGATRPSKTGKYTATFTVPGTANYGGLSKTVSFTIAPTTYTVKFSANGGTLPKGKSMAAQTFAPGKAAKLRGNAFTRKGYVFIGWSTRKNGPVAYRNTQSVKNLAAAGKSVTLYAAWAKAEYKVVFDASGGRGKMPTQKFTYGKAQKLNGNKFTRKGYVFGGWAIRDPLATIPKIAYKNGQAVANLSRDGRTVKLYAVWKRR